MISINIFIMKRGLFFLLNILICLIISSILSSSYCQEISGKVTDNSGIPLPGTTVTVQNSFLGTYSRLDGTYSLKLSKDGIYNVKFSFVGYEVVNQEVTVKGKLIVNITLIPAEIMAHEVIVNGTRAGNKTPITYTNVSNEIVSKSNSGQDLPFLIGLTPSLVETSETGTGIGYTGLRIRGTDGTRINVTVDGIPMNDAESQQVFWVDLPDLASSVDNIQVQRGVGTSSNGSGAFGASINIATKSPENIPFAEISTTIGSFNTMKNTIIAGTGLINQKFAFQMRLSNLKSDGYIDRTGCNNSSAYLSGVWISGRSRLRANLILGEEHTGISWWGVPKEMLSLNRQYNPAGQYTDESGAIHYYNNESDNYRQNHFQLIYSLNINKYLFLQTAFHYTFGKGYYEEYAEDQLLENYGLSPFYIGNSEISSTDMIRQKWMDNDFYGLVYTLNYIKDRIDAVFGGGLNSYSGNQYGNVIWMRNAGNTEKDYQWYLNKSTKNELNLYGKLNYRISEKLNGFGDLNYRYIYYKISGPDDDLRLLQQKHEFNFVNPKAGLFYSITSNQDAYISFAVAQKEPTRSDYKEANGDDKAVPLPEELLDAEGGYNLRSSKSAFGINLFGMLYNDQLVPTGELSSVGYPIMTNVKNSYRTGIEFSAALKPLNPINWQLNMTLSSNKIQDFTEYYTDHSTIDNSDTYKSKKLGTVDIAYSPSLIVSSDLALKFSGNIGIHIITKYVGKQYFDNTMSHDRIVDPYLVNNFRVDYNTRIKNTKNIDIQLFVNNFLDNKYVNNGYGGNWYQDGKENTWAYYFPQAGINFLLKLSIGF
jgi:iron complex outermembrane receptor protein